MKLQQKKTIDELVRDAIHYISIQSYSAVSVYYYSRIWRKLLKYAHEKQTEHYSMELGFKFYHQLTGSDPDDIPGKKSQHKIRALKVLNDLALGNEVKKKYTYMEPFVPEPFVEILQAYGQYLAKKGQKRKTVETKLSRIRIFLRHLDLRGILLEEVDFQAIADFYLFLSAQYAVNAKSNVQFTLRDFLIFVESVGAVKSGTSELITTIYSNKHERLPSTYNVEEINKILAAINRSTKYGKRDYASATDVLLNSLSEILTCVKDFQYVLFDSWFSWPKVIKGVKAMRERMGE